MYNINALNFPGEQTLMLGSINIFTSYVKRSGHQVRSKSDVYPRTGFKLQDRAVAVLV